jgi:hypothetical protein
LASFVAVRKPRHLVERDKPTNAREGFSLISTLRTKFEGERATKDVCADRQLIGEPRRVTDEIPSLVEYWDSGNSSWLRDNARIDEHGIGKSDSALSIAPATSNAPVVAATSVSTPNQARVRGRAKKDPNATLYRTGARNPTPDEELRARGQARELLRIRPTPLVAERIERARVESNPSLRSKVTPSITELNSAMAPVGTDLVTAPTPATGAVAGTAASATATPADAALAASATYLSAVDNSALPSFPEIRTQGGIGSCVAFAVGYYQYTHELGLLANWNNQNAVNTTKISPRWLYNLVNGGYDSGTWAGEIYAVLSQHGALSWADFPYIEDKSDPKSYLQWPTGTALWRKALGYKALEYGYLAIPNNATTMTQVKAMLANGHVLTMQTYVYSWKFEQVDDDPSTTLDDGYVGQAVASSVEGWEGSHQMTMVGFDDNVWVDINANGTVEPSERGAFKIANSWGPDWQNAGFAWLHYDAMFSETQVPEGPTGESRHPAISSLSWVTPRTNYQPELLAEFTAKTADRGSLRFQVNRAEYDAAQPFDSMFPYAFHMN